MKNLTEETKEYHVEFEGWKVLIQEYYGEWRIIPQWEPWVSIGWVKTEEEAVKKAKQILAKRPWN